MTFTELDARRLGRVRRFFAQHPPASDVLVCVLYTLSATGEIVGAVRAIGTGDHRAGASGATAALVLLALSVVALAFRRRAPVTVTAATVLLTAGTVAVSGTTGSLSIGFALALYVVAAARSARVSWLVLGLSVAAVTAALIAWGADDTYEGFVTTTGTDGTVISQPVSTDPAIYLDVPTVLVLGLIALVVGANVRGRRLHVRSLVDRHAQLVETGEQQARIAAAAEQTRIAREMHDVVAHGLTVMVALSDGARKSVRRSPDAAEEALDLLSETGRAALADMRRMLGVLRGGDAPLEPQPGSQDLDALVQSFRTAGMTVRLTTAGPPLPEDAALTLTVYRVVQESLTNALRHAGATATVDVLVRHGERRIGIEVVDDGGGRHAEPVAEAPATTERRLSRLGERVSERVRGEDVPVPTVRTGRGLVGMRERAAVYGGTVAAGPHHAGWRVHVELRTDDVARPGPAPTAPRPATVLPPVPVPLAARHDRGTTPEPPVAPQPPQEEHP